jgi:dTDP-4-amino-4,6-dideoxygalactose transaminase
LLVEDCAHAHGSRWKDVPIGTTGIAATFSFQSSKLMTAGEGGIIITNDDEVERLTRSVHDCGRMPGQWFYSHFMYGSNYRLSEWQGAVLSCQLARLEQQVAKRHENGLLLDRLLADVKGITPQVQDNRCSLNGRYAYIIHVDSLAFSGVPIKRFAEAMGAEGISLQASYPPIHTLDLFQNGRYKSRLCPNQATGDHAFLKADFPVTGRAAWETVWIPQYALLGDEQDMHEIAQAIEKIQRLADELK